MFATILWMQILCLWEPSAGKSRALCFLLCLCCPMKLENTATLTAARIQSQRCALAPFVVIQVLPVYCIHFDHSLHHGKLYTAATASGSVVRVMGEALSHGSTTLALTKQEPQVRGGRLDNELYCSLTVPSAALLPHLPAPSPALFPHLHCSSPALFPHPAAPLPALRCVRPMHMIPQVYSIVVARALCSLLNVATARIPPVPCRLNVVD